MGVGGEKQGYLNPGILRISTLEMKWIQWQTRLNWMNFKMVPNLTRSAVKLGSLCLERLADPTQSNPIGCLEKFFSLNDSIESQTATELPA